MPNGDYRGLKKQGDPFSIPAMAHNRWQNSADYTEGLRGNTIGTTGALPEGLIYIQNNSGLDVVRYGILGISGIVISPTDNLLEFQDRPALTGVTPTTTNHTGKFVVCYEPIPNNAVGRAFVFGICVVQVDAAASPGDQLDVKNGSSSQVTNTPGGLLTTLYGGDDSNGNHWAVARFGGSGDDLVPVELSMDGGGDATTDGTNLYPATWTYSMSNALTETAMATMVPLRTARPSSVSMKPATWGIAAHLPNDRLPYGQNPGYLPGEPSSSSSSSVGTNPWRLIWCDEVEQEQLDCVIATSSSSSTS